MLCLSSSIPASIVWWYSTCMYSKFSLIHHNFFMVDTYIRDGIICPSPARDADCSQGAQVPGEGGEASTTTSHPLCGARNRGTYNRNSCVHTHLQNTWLSFHVAEICTEAFTVNQPFTYSICMYVHMCIRICVYMHSTYVHLQNMYLSFHVAALCRMRRGGKWL